MIKQVPVSELRPGMYLQKLDMHWTAHPFWRGAFLLGPDDPSKIAETGVEKVWIDTDKGLDTLAPDTQSTLPGEAPLSAEADEEIEPIAQPEVRYIEMPDDLPPPAVDFPIAKADVKEIAIREAARVCMNATKALKRVFADIRLGRALDSEQCSAIVKDVIELVLDDAAALILVARLKTHDDYTHMHSVAVCALMVALARQLGFDHQKQLEAGLSGLVHDVGKLMVPAEFLNKPSPLTPAEYEVVKSHVRHGHALLSESGSRCEMALDVCLHHHERLNGTGYPFGLRGGEISVYARMAGICDVYDALTSKRPHRGRVEPGIALRQMISQAGQFDLKVLQAFVKTVGIYPVGSLVRLKNQQLAIVVSQDSGNLLKPLIRSFYSIPDQCPLVSPYLAQADGDNAILSLETPDSLGEDVMGYIRQSETVLRAD